MTVDEIGLLE